MKNFLTILLLFFIAGASTGCSPSDPNKTAEKRILNEVNRLTETSGKILRSEEFRSALIRLNELGKGFPERREDISREGDAVKGFVSQFIDDEVKIAQKWSELLQLPLTDKYRNCVMSQARSSDLNIKRFSALIDEINVFLDPLVVDKAALETKLEPIRSRKNALEAEQSENQAIVDRECSRPGSNTSDQ